LGFSDFGSPSFALVFSSSLLRRVGEGDSSFSVGDIVIVNGWRVRLTDYQSIHIHGVQFDRAALSRTPRAPNVHAKEQSVKGVECGNGMASRLDANKASQSELSARRHGIAREDLPNTHHV
jgi:hypothetical protein